MEGDLQRPVGGNRLTKYNIAAWLRMLAAMKVIQRSEAASNAKRIRQSGYAPWPSES
jgi:hypothetical protein